MRKIIDLLSITVLVASPVALGMVYAQTSASQAVVQPIEVITDKNFPLNRPQAVNFEPNEGFYKLTKRQKDNQLRDWLLMTALSGKGLSSEQISQGVYDLPTMRYDFMNPVANFEYGTTRSRYVGDGKIVALVPKATFKEQRMDDLAHIADRHRKDQGEKPKIIEVFEYEIAPDKQSSVITRKEPINGEQLFSSAYGYFETTINSQNDLQSFLNQVDDITFAQVNSYSLSVGGRKIKSYKYQGIRLEDIAALWQSGKKYNNSGFSLDPNFDYPGLEKSLDRAKQLLQSFRLDGKLVISDQDIEKAKQGLLKQEIVPYRELIDKLKNFLKSKDSKKAFFEGDIGKAIKQARDSYLKKQNQEITLENQRYKSQVKAEIEVKIKSAKQSGTSAIEIQQMLDAEILQAEQKFKQFQDNVIKQKDKELQQFVNTKIIQKQQEVYKFLDTPQTQGFQSARYDGDLKGTEVGMVLFYTDLLMKLWDFNFENSTIKTGIEDFKPETKISISSIYQKELEDLSSARLWLGPNDKGFQAANENKNILFARNTTQIYAKSSNPLRPKDEQQADVSINAFVSWWNDHYEEVARYEPQYEQLNQIMKWSLVINWLNQSNQDNSLGFLQNVSIKRDNWFPDWIKAQASNLKFKKWQQIGFFERGYKGTKTETMPLLVSEKFNRFGKNNSSFSGGVSLADRRTFQNRPSLPKNIELEKPIFRSNIDYKSVKVESRKLEFNTLDGTKYRVKTLNKTVSETIVEPKPQAKLRSPNAEITSQPFSSKITQLTDGVKLENTVGGTEFGNLNISKTANGFKVGFESRDIDAGYSLASRLSVGTSRLNPKKVGVLDALREMDDVVFVRYSPSQPNDYFVQLSKSNNKWLKFSEQPLADGSGGGAKPPSKRIMSVAEPEDGARNFNFESLNEAQVSQQTQGFQQFSGKGANYKSSYNYRKEAQKLAAEPVQYLLKQKLDLQFRIKNIDVELKAGNYTRAAKSINESIKLHGSEPNLMLRKAAVNVHEGRLKVERITPEGVKPFKQNFFDEINNRNFKVIENNTEFIYVQDSPGLNNLQFKQSISQSVPFSSGARFYKLQPGEISRVKIRQSGLGDVSVSSNPSTKTTGSNVGDSLRFQFQNSPQRFVTNNECQENDESDKNQNTNKCPLEKPVYVVTTSEKN